MVELLALNNPKDIEYVKRLLEDFVEKTGSLIAQDLLKLWPEPTTRFVKVYARISRSLTLITTYIKQPSLTLFFLFFFVYPSPLSLSLLPSFSVKVFPYEYQRALKQFEEAKRAEQMSNGNVQATDARVKDIEDAVTDLAMEERKLDKIR